MSDGIDATRGPDRQQLARVLGLPEDAPIAALRPAAARLLSALKRRRAACADPDEGLDLDLEIAELEQAITRYVSTRGSRKALRVTDRRPLMGALLGTAAAVIIWLFGSSGLSGDAETEAPRPTAGIAARLELTGPLAGATLRVLDADREKVWAELPAQDAVLELQRGRYALEVSRPDCPDRWTRSTFFEAGQTYRFAPSICSGEGQLVIRSNVEADQLIVDGAKLGAPGTGALGLTVGDHEIRLEKAGYRAYETSVRIRPDETLEMRAQLAPTRPEATAPASADLARSLLPSPAPPTAAAAPEPFDLGELREAIAPRPGQEAATRLLQREGLGGLPDGGSTAWHDRMSRTFLDRFDSDASGRIDRLEESDAVSCDYWRETEASFERGGLGLSMAHYYGFDGSEWHRDALGFTRAIRAAAYDRMRACGLQA